MRRSILGFFESSAYILVKIFSDFMFVTHALPHRERLRKFGVGGLTSVLE
jgi:hypothetical protein